MIESIKGAPALDLLEGGTPTCAGCGGELGLKLALKALGKNTVVINSSGCMTMLANYPYTPLKVSWLHNAIENTAASATGIVRALRIRKREMAVLCYAGDGATYDIGAQSLSGAAMRGDPFIYICYNNQSYGNTGVQWASSTPYLANTKTTPPGKKSKGNLIPPKNMVQIMADHGIYSATASLAFPIDYMNKVRKAAAKKAPTYIELLAACPTGWGYDPALTIEISKIAVQTGFWPLYEIEAGKLHVNFKPKKLRPIQDFIKLQERYGHLADEDTKVLQDMINKDWKSLLEREHE